MKYTLNVREGLENSTQKPVDKASSENQQKKVSVPQPRPQPTRSGTNKQERGQLPPAQPSRGGTPQQIVRQCLSLCGADM